MLQQFFTKLSDKERKIFTAAAIFVVAAILDRLFLSPTTEKLSKLNDDIKEEENSIKKDLHFLSYEEKILKENEVLRPYYSNKEKTEEEIIAAFLKKIEILATQANINLVKVNPSEAKQKKGYKEYYANLECSGPLQSMITFLHLVDSSPDLLKTVKMDLGAKKIGSDEIVANLSIAKIIIDPAKEAPIVAIAPLGDSNRSVQVDQAPKNMDSIIRDDTDKSKKDAQVIVGGFSQE